MFQLTDTESTSSRDKQMAVVRVGALTVALLALGAAVYFFSFLPYAQG